MDQYLKKNFYSTTELMKDLSLFQKYVLPMMKKKTLESHFNRLTDPNGMGGLIKCIYISKNQLDLNYFNE